MIETHPFFVVFIQGHAQRLLSGLNILGAGFTSIGSIAGPIETAKAMIRYSSRHDEHVLRSNIMTGRQDFQHPVHYYAYFSQLDNSQKGVHADTIMARVHAQCQALNNGSFRLGKVGLMIIATSSGGPEAMMLAQRVDAAHLVYFALHDSAWAADTMYMKSIQSPALNRLPPAMKVNYYQDYGNNGYSDFEEPVRPQDQFGRPGELHLRMGAGWTDVWVPIPAGTSNDVSHEIAVEYGINSEQRANTFETLYNAFRKSTP